MRWQSGQASPSALAAVRQTVIEGYIQQEGCLHRSLMVYLTKILNIWGRQNAMILRLLGYHSLRSPKNPSDRLSIYFAHPQILSPIGKSWILKLWDITQYELHELRLMPSGLCKHWLVWLWQITKRSLSYLGSMYFSTRGSWGPFTDLASLSIACSLGLPYLLFRRSSIPFHLPDEWWFIIVNDRCPPYIRLLVEPCHRLFRFTALTTPHGSCFSTCIFRFPSLKWTQDFCCISQA